MTPNINEEVAKLPVKLPMKSLSDIDELERFVNVNEENKQTYVSCR